jgi:transcriptional regulator with XRE-family HTH domain
VTSRDWARTTTSRAAGEIKRRRGEHTVQWLSDRTADYGHRISRSRISDLERGSRGGALGVAELIVLAKALGVPPVVLVFALGRERTVELLPDTEVDTWAAAKWFTGEAPFPGSNEAVEDSPPAYFRTQDRMIADWNQLRREVAKARAQVVQHPGRPDLEHMAQGDVDYFEGRLRSVEEQIRLHRASVRRYGVDLGALPPELAHVEQRDADR